MAATILVVEDNPDSLEVMTCLLEAGGHHLLAARDGEEGLEAASRYAPDLIICDLQLPKISGIDLCRQLKGSPALIMTPVVAVTAFSMVGDRERVIEAGFDGYISKPINPRSFLQQVESFCPSLSCGGSSHG